MRDNDKSCNIRDILSFNAKCNRPYDCFIVHIQSNICKPSHNSFTCSIFTTSYFFLHCICKLKFRLSEKHEKICAIFLRLLYIYLVNVQTTRMIFLNFVCFSESPNFNNFMVSRLNTLFLCTIYFDHFTAMGFFLTNVCWTHFGPHFNTIQKKVPPFSL